MHRLSWQSHQAVALVPDVCTCVYACVKCVVSPPSFIAWFVKLMHCTPECQCTRNTHTHTHTRTDAHAQLDREQQSGCNTIGLPRAMRPGLRFPTASCQSQPEMAKGAKQVGRRGEPSVVKTGKRVRLPCVAQRERKVNHTASIVFSSFSNISCTFKSCAKQCETGQREKRNPNRKVFAWVRVSVCVSVCLCVCVSVCLCLCLCL